MNPRVWLIWISIAAATVMLARNPLYALALFIVVQLVRLAHEREDEEFKVSLVRIGIMILVFSAVYNALFVHSGDSVLFSLPEWPLIGGPITLEAILEGMANGLTLVTLLALFLTLNAVLPANDMLRMTPMALRDIGVVVLIAFTYIPETRRHLARIREAQAIRGHEMHGIRDWQPIVVPLLVGGLERSMQLSESMVARGYGSVSDRSSSLEERVSLIVCLTTALIGWLLALWIGWPGWLIMSLSILGLMVILWRRGKRSRRTSLKPNKWTTIDGFVTGAAALVFIIIIGVNIRDSSLLLWNPYPSVTLPDFDWRIGLAILFLAIPALIRPSKRVAVRDN